MAQNSACYPQQQQPQRQYTQVYPQSQPQNIYQQLGKPQPQPQGNLTYQQSSALVVQPQGGHPFSQHHAQQLPAQVQTPFPLGEAPHAPPQTLYQKQTPHASPQTPYPQSQMPYLSSQPPYTQSQASYESCPVSQTPYISSQTPYQQAQYPGQHQSQQAYSSHSQLQISYVPQTSFTSQTPAAVPTSSSGSSWRVPASWTPPVAHSAALAQQAQSQVQMHVQPLVTSQTLAQTPAQRPLPQPSTGAYAPILPLSSQSADNPSPGSSRPFPTPAIQTMVGSSSTSLSPKRGRPLPTPTGSNGKQTTADLGRFPNGFSSSLANSAFSTQSSISSQPQPLPITTKRTPSPSKGSLPAPSSHNPVKKSESVGLSRTSSFAIQKSASTSPLSAMPKRRSTPPKFQSQPSSESSSPTKENASTSSLNKFSGLPAAASMIPKFSISTTTSSSTSTTSATTSSSISDTSVPPPKKFTPIWKHTIPDLPAPAWGYAVGMVSEPYPKPKAQVPTQPAAAGAPPAHHRAQSVSQQPQFGGQQTHGRQARPASGLICGGCNDSIMGRIVSAMGSRWHPACFRCTVCNELLEHVSSYEHEGRPYCHLDYHEVRSSLR